jgi:hypothetical protein
MNFIERGMKATIEDLSDKMLLDMLFLVIERHPEIAATIINDILEPKASKKL